MKRFSLQKLIVLLISFMFAALVPLEGLTSTDAAPAQYQYDSNYDISVVPVYAEYVEIDPGDYSEKYQIRGKEGWHLLILDVAIFNNTNVFLSPDWASSESQQRKVFKLYTKDGYEYKGFISDVPEILYEDLPPMYCLFNYFQKFSSYMDGSSQTWVSTPSLVFFVPTSITEYYFSYNNESPGISIDFDGYMGAMYKNAYSAIQERVTSYPQCYSTNFSNATIELESGITVHFEGCTATSFGINAVFSVNNNTGYDYQVRDLSISIIDDSGMNYGVQSPELALPPKGTKSFRYSWMDMPEGIELDPKVVIIRTSQDTYIQRVNEQQSDFSQIVDLNRVGNYTISQLSESEIYCESPDGILNAFGNQLSFTLANQIMYIHDDYKILQIVNLDSGKSINVSIDY